MNRSNYQLLNGVIDIKLYKDYNIVKYIESVQEMKSMVLDGIVSKYDICSKYELNQDVKDYLYYVEDEPFYISPVFNDVKTNAEASTLNPKFILFSAPGAAGKSSLAKYLSYRFNALYWNLAKLKLGTNSFAGSILNAVGPPAYSQFISDLNKAKTLLIVDAFDEAEIISGRKMVSGFIDDMSNNLKDYTDPPVFLLARTETAQYIASFCAENRIPLIHYEISFFLEDQAKEFIERSIVPKGRKATSADTESINSYYDTVKKNITQSECQSFLGYAPVLEAIAKHIKDCSNRAKLISMLSTQTDCVSIIMQIMEDLLVREQSEKVTTAFKQKCAEAHPEFSEWDKLYSPEEQLVRLISYILFKDTKYSNYSLEYLPPQLIDEYQEILDTFLCQHPFVRIDFEHGVEGNSRIGFTGPAFRDYTLAKLILSEKHEDLANMYFDEEKEPFYSPSQIFFDCYVDIAKSSVRASHLFYVFESYRAKATALEHPYLQCSEFVKDEDSGAIGAITLFGMTTNKKMSERKEIVLDMVIDGDTVMLEQVSNLSLDIPHLNVKIGKKGTDSRIYNSSIVCNKLIWGTDNIVVESYAPEGCLIMCNEDAEGKKPRFGISSDRELRISIPNINGYYRLVPYKYDFTNPSTVDITKFTHAMRCIMMEFRTHKKDTLAKDWERIDNVTVGSNPFKQKVLKYMKEKEIIYKYEHLYKVNTGKMQQAGISYSALSRMRVDLLKMAYDDFCAWSIDK